MIVDQKKLGVSPVTLNHAYHNLHKQIANSAKNVLLQHIEFKEAMLPDREQDSIYAKYKPINAGYRQHTATASSSKLVRQNSTPTNGLNNNQQHDSESDDLPKPKVILYPENAVDLTWKGVRRIGPGLSNQGNTCFLNSVLQVLTHTTPLFNFLLDTSHKEECRTVGYCMLCELKNHVARVSRHNPQHGSIRPMSIIQKLSCIGKQFKFGRQEDSHEFLRYVIEGLQKSCIAGRNKLDRYSKETTVIHRIFGGYYRSQVECLRCHFKSNTYDPMLDLNLDIKEASSVVAALRKHIQPERLDGENRYQCDKCRTKTTAQKRGAIHKCPNILTLQLKRFDYQRCFGGKVSKDLQFSETLDLRPFMATKGPPVPYHLYSVLVHSGYSCNSGHYYCYVKGPNGIWYEMNDSQVSQVGIGRVLKAQAYLLFYIKDTAVKTHKTPTTPNVPSPNVKTNPKINMFNNTAKNLGQPVSRPLQGNTVSGSVNQIPTRPSFSPTVIGMPSKKQQQQQPNEIRSPQAVSPSLTKKAEHKDSQQVAKKHNGDIPKKQHKTDVNKPKSLAGLESLKSYESSDSNPSSPSENQNRPMKNNLNLNLPIKSRTSLSQPIENKSNLNRQTKNNLGINQPIKSPPANSNQSQQTPSSDDGDTSKRHTSSPLSNGARTRLKIPLGTPSRHDNFKVWTPTKASFLPRVFYKSKSSDPSLSNTSSHLKSPPIPESILSSTSKATIIFGPALPPSFNTQTHQRERTSSITSETNSICSVSSTTGDWDVSDKSNKQNVSETELRERQHAGWTVKSMTSPKHSPDTDETTALLGNGNKRNQSKKSKRKHKSDTDDEEEPSRTSAKELKKRKKKEKKKKHKKHSRHRDEKESHNDSDDSRDAHEPCNGDSINDEKSQKSKKKKRKRSRHHHGGDSDEENLISPTKRKRSYENDQKESKTDGEKKLKSKPDVVVRQWDDQSRTTGITWDGAPSDLKTPVMQSLESNSSHGYGNKVLTWRGNRSLVDVKSKRDLASSDDERDVEWDEFYDEGKRKKVKASNQHVRSYSSNLNVFQKVQDRRNDSRGKSTGVSFKVKSKSSYSRMR